MSQENLEQQQKQAQKTAQDAAYAALPGWKKTIANVVENPLVKYPLDLLGAPSRLVNVGLEEGVKALPDSWQTWLSQPLGKNNDYNDTLVGGILGMDPAKINDGESVLSRLNPFSDKSYSSSDLYRDSPHQGVTGLRNFVQDVIHDPLSYVSLGGTRVGIEAAEAARAAAVADDAKVALTAAHAAGDVDKIAEATKTFDAAAAAADKAATPTKTLLPHTTKGRADLVAELVVHDPSLAQHSEELAKGIRQGFRFMSPEARAAIGIDKVGLRLNGTEYIIPGTEKLTAPVARVGLAGRTAASKLPLPSGAVRGSEDTAKILSGTGVGDFQTAAAQRYWANQERILGGRAKNLGVRDLVDTVKTSMKKTNASEREAMVYAAETTPQMEPLNDLGAKMLGIYEQTAGRKIDPQYLRDPTTNVPHILEPSFRRTLRRTLEKGTEAEKARAEAFLRQNGMESKDLLETSGHLDNARILDVMPDGTPKRIQVGPTERDAAGKLRPVPGMGQEIVIDDGTIRGLNNNPTLRALFPGYSGKFYMDDPVKIFDAYNSSLAKDAGRSGGMFALGRTASPRAQVIEGDLADTLTQYDEALRQQSEPLRQMEAVQANPFTPGAPTPVPAAAPTVPGGDVLSRLRRYVAGQSGTDRFLSEGVLERIRHDGLSHGEIADLLSEAFPEVSGWEVGKGAPGFVDEATSMLDDAKVNSVRGRKSEFMDYIGGLSDTHPISGTGDPNEFFKPVEGLDATDEVRAFYRGKDSPARQYTGQVAEEIGNVSEPIVKDLYDLRVNMMQGLRDESKASETVIKDSTATIRKYQKRLADLGKLTPDNAQEMGDIINAVDKDIADLKHELGSRRSLFGRAKGAIQGVQDDLAMRYGTEEKAMNAAARKEARARATAVEDQLNKNLKWLEDVRARADAKIGEGPRALADEIRRRNDELFRPVREAHDALTAKAATIARPHTDDEVRKAEELLAQNIGDIDPEYAAASEEYAKRVRRLEEARKAATKNRKGEISIPAQARIDQAMQQVQEQRLKLGQMFGKGESAYSKAKREADNLRTQLAGLGEEAAVAPEAAAAGETVAERQAKIAQQTSAEIAAKGFPPAQNTTRGYIDSLSKDDLDRLLAEKGDDLRRNNVQSYNYAVARAERLAGEPAAQAAPKAAAKTTTAETSRAALQAKLKRIEAQFNQRGQFHALSEAEKVRDAHAEWQTQVEAATTNERKAYDRARQAALNSPERVVTDQVGNRLRGAEGFAGGAERRVGEPLPANLVRENNPERTELEALSHLRASGQNAGVKEQQTKIAQLTAEIETKTASIPGAKKQARAAATAEVKAQFAPTMENLEQQRAAAAKLMDTTVGIHMSESARIQNRLDVLAEVKPRLLDRKQLTEYRAELESLRTELRASGVNPKNASTPNELIGVVDDLEAIASMNPLMDDPTWSATESQLHLQRAELQRLEGHDMTVNQMNGMSRAANKDKNFGKVMVAGMANGWSLLHDGLPEVGDVLIDGQLRQMMRQTWSAIDNPGLLGRWFNEATNLFKTYATLTPGFHIRNMMSGLFMNASDGVSLAHQIEGLKKWQEFTANPSEWLAAQDSRMQRAFDATFGSGAGGRYTETGVRDAASNKVLDRVINNYATRKSAALGERIEGGMRLGMALNSIDRGDSVQQALSRITRIHFDYSQVSQLDQSMKRIIPFWTFMSRNLPLQITQMFVSPAAYRAYDAAVANFSVPNDPLTPQYWEKLGTFNTGVKVGGLPLYFQPDFGFTRIGQDVTNLTSPGAFLGNVNPVLAAPIDFAMKRDSFYQRNFGPTDYHSQSGLIGTPLTALASVLPGDQTNEAGQVSDNLTNLVRGLVPPIDQIARLFPSTLGGGGDQQRQGEAFVRWLGGPVRTLSDKQRETEAKNQLFSARDELARKRKMAQAIMASAS